MISKLIINPEIETICKQKAEELYNEQKLFIENKLQKSIKDDLMINEIKSMINDKRLIVVKKEFTRDFRPGSELAKFRFALVKEYAENAVKEVTEVQ